MNNYYHRIGVKCNIDDVLDTKIEKKKRLNI